MRLKLGILGACMNNKEILRQYLGDEVFEKFEKNFDKDYRPISFSWKKPPFMVINNAFLWSSTPEGSGFWCNIRRRLGVLSWEDLLLEIHTSKEEHKLLLQMFICAYMGWIAPEDPVYYDMSMEESTLFKMVFDLVWEE